MMMEDHDFTIQAQVLLPQEEAQSSLGYFASFSLPLCCYLDPK
jgi:hypothetical protein